MTDHECPKVQTSPVYESETGDATIVIEEVYAGTAGADCIGNGVAVIVDDGEDAALIVVDPERALEIAAGITEAATWALHRRQMGW